jgi:predicted Zn-dependent protease
VRIDVSTSFNNLRLFLRRWGLRKRRQQRHMINPTFLAGLPDHALDVLRRAPDRITLKRVDQARHDRVIEQQRHAIELLD